jgi:hypothetical protein
MARRDDFVWDPDRDARLRALYAEGIPWATIAAAFGISRAAAQAHGHRLGLATRAKFGNAVQRVPGAVAGHVSPHHAVLANSAPARRAEGGGHALPAGNPLTWSLIICNTPTLGDVLWPE